LPRLVLNLGGRYDIERLPKPFPTNKDNFSVRLGLAWNPADKWVVRAGFGTFFDRLPLAFLNNAIQKNGARAFEQVAFGDLAAQIFATTGGGTALAPFGGIAPSIYRVASRFETPYSAQTHIGIEHQLSTDVTVKADYLFTRGISLSRISNINLQPPVVLTLANAASLGVSPPTPQQIGRAVFGRGRIDPQFDGIYQLENSANSTYHGLSLSMNKRLSAEWEIMASYTLSKAIDNASDFDEQPANPYNPRGERALSRQDIRHRFVINGLFDLPFGDDENDKNSAKKDGLVDAILSHIEIAPIITISSGRPVDPLTGSDEAQSGAYPFVDRPLGFSRNNLITKGFINFDLRALKYIPFGEKRRLDFVVEAFNLFNHPNHEKINPFFGSGIAPAISFGSFTAFTAPRQLRFSLDFEF
jgi:hypothetical protein